MGHATRLPWERERTVAAPQPLAEPNEKHTRALISLRPASRAPSLPPLTTHAQTNQPTPVFGSGSTFGAGTGFAGFTGVSSSSAAPAAEAGGEEGADGGDDDAAAAEEECQAEFKPVVQLEEVETSTGEEDEECMVDL